MNTDAYLDSTILGNVGVAPSHGSLSFNGATHSVEYARKFDQDSVTRGLDDAAMMLGNLRIDEFATVRLKRRQSAFLITTNRGVRLQ